MASTPRTPAPERPPPPVPTPRPPLETTPRPTSPSSQPGDEYHTPRPVPTPPPPLETTLPQPGNEHHTPPPVPAPPPPLETTLPPPLSPSSPPGDEYHTPPPSLADGSPRDEASSFPSDGREGGGGGAPPKSPQLSPMRLAAPRLLPPPSPRARAAGQNGQGQQEEGGAPPGDDGPGPRRAAPPAAAAPAAQPPRPPLRLATDQLARSPSSQRSLATTSSPSSLSPSPTPPSPLTPAPAVNNSSSSSSQRSTPRRAETKLPLPLSSPATIAAHFDPVEEAATSPLHLGGKARLDHQHQHQQEQHAAAVENGGSVPSDVAAVAAVGDRRELSVTLRLATALLSLAAFSVIASARTSGWAGDYYARHLQYRYAVAANVIVCAYSIAQSFGEIRRLISPRFIYRSMSSYYFSMFLDQVLAYLLMSASSAAASRNDLWVSRFGTDAFNRKITSALWLSFIAFLMLALNALISTANLFSMV